MNMAASVQAGHGQAKIPLLTLVRSRLADMEVSAATTNEHLSSLKETIYGSEIASPDSEPSDEMGPGHEGAILGLLSRLQSTIENNQYRARQLIDLTVGEG